MWIEEIFSAPFLLNLPEDIQNIHISITFLDDSKLLKFLTLFPRHFFGSSAI